VSIDLERELEALVKTWAGACDITFEIDATVRELLLADSNLAFCVNELSKEIVGNAFRHGGSNELHFSIEAGAESTVELIATSNGLPPAANPKPGVGLRMFDELSITWSMVPNKNNVGAKISLTLPL
jgi:signal transduction histidine kinase